MEKRYKIYIILSALVLCFLVSIFILLPLFTSEETPAWEKTHTLLKDMETRSVSDINQSIQTAQKNVMLNKAGTPLETLQVQFQNVIVIGDSIGEGLLDYRILDDQSILAKRGLRVDNCDEEIDIAISRVPTALFFEFGMNDMTYWRGNAEGFANMYGEKLAKVRSALPDTKVYVNALLPVSQQAIASVPVYGSYTAFNEALEKECKRQKVTFIDNAFIIQGMEVPYEFDGIHPTYEFYQKWATNMARVAGL